MARIHLVLGGARSGKSRHAEQLARSAAADSAKVVYVATALPADGEMTERIRRHQQSRPDNWETVEVGVGPGELTDVLTRHCGPERFVLVDCLTVWISQLVAPPPDLPATDPDPEVDSLVSTLAGLDGQVAFVSNEIGMGVMPMGELTRRTVDALGRLHQQLAALADDVTLMVAGLPHNLKSSKDA